MLVFLALHPSGATEAIQLAPQIGCAVRDGSNAIAEQEHRELTKNWVRKHDPVLFTLSPKLQPKSAADSVNGDFTLMNLSLIGALGLSLVCILMRPSRVPERSMITVGSAVRVSRRGQRE